MNAEDTLSVGGSMQPANQDDDTPSTNRYVADPDRLDAIYNLMVVMAKHNSVQIPAELFPTPTRHKVSTEESDARGREYDITKTIEYQRQQLPAESTLPSEVWNDAFSSSNQLPWPSFRKRNCPAHAGLTNVLAWDIDENATRNGASVDYKEFGYDDRGYVCRLGQDSALRASSTSGREINEHILLAEVDTPMPSTTTSHVGQRFGREWIFGLNGVCDNKILSLAAFQLRVTNGSLDSSRRRLAKCFSIKFREKWSAETSRDLWGRSDDLWVHSTMFDRSSWKDLVFQFHMRVFTTNPLGRLPGPGLKRSSGELVYGERSEKLNMVELRYSVGLKTTWKLDCPVFTLVTMADSTASRVQKLGQLSDMNEWNTAGVHPSFRGTGIAAFAFRIHSLLEEWETHWSNLIDGIRKALNPDLDTILSPRDRRKFMIDGSDLQLSDFYFTIIQILRIAADWIQESTDDLRCTVGDIERLYFSPITTKDFATFLPLDPSGRDAEIESFKQNWGSVMSKQQRIAATLFSRIAKIQEETKSLRDGLFNATSVHEATESTKLNHYILVFTVVTVIYLPLGFITALFALGFFDLQDQRHIRWFVVTIISVAFATYLSSWLWIRTVQGSIPDQWQSFKKGIIGLGSKVLGGGLQFRFSEGRKGKMEGIDIGAVESRA